MPRTATLPDMPPQGADHHFRALEALYASAPVNSLFASRLHIEAESRSRIEFTVDEDETLETVEQLKERFPQLQAPPSDDICYATQNRQSAVKMMAPDCDLVLVVGSTNSSNSVRLVEVALSAGATAAYLVEDREAVHEEWLDGVRTVGVSSGASVPENLVKDVLAWLEERGFPVAERVRAAEESLIFALPHQLRRDEARMMSGGS